MAVLELGADAAGTSRYRAMRGVLRATTALFGVSGVRALAAAALIATIGVLPAWADDWTGAVSASWLVNGNWLDGSTPTAADNVFIDTTSPNLTTIGVAVAAQGLTVSVGNTGIGTLHIFGGGSLSDVNGSVGTVAGSTGTAAVNAPGSKWTNSGTLNVGDLGDGTLDIQNGGAVSDTGGFIGGGTGSTGVAAVSGAGSTWTNSVNFFVGFQGQGTLAVDTGGAVSDGVGNIGFASGSIGAATVTGAGSKWTNSTNLFVGFGGQGTLTISNGGVVSDVDGSIGDQAGSTGAATVSGFGTWTNSGNFFVGREGDGTLTIEGLGAVSDANGSIGDQAGSTGTVTVNGLFAAWTNSTTLVVGNEGHGTLTISSGGAASDANGIIGGAAGSTGTATVTGAGSTWTNSSFFAVGAVGDGTLSVEAGGSVSGNLSAIGNAAGSTGTATVTGAGSSWTASNTLSVGEAGDGTLTVKDGGSVIDGAGIVGDFAAAVGAAAVTGASSKWTNSGGLNVGNSGDGTLEIENGGTVSDANGVLGFNSGSTGTATVTGAGSNWTNTGSFIVGRQATGTLSVEDVGAVSDNFGFVGSLAGSNGAATVTGAGSTWTNGHALEIGDLGNGTLTISAGGVVSDIVGDIAVGFGSIGKATVTGTGSKWTNSGDFVVGDLGNGTLTIADGGAVSDFNGFVGNAAGSTGTVIVTGAGSKWTNSGFLATLDVGVAGTGTLTVEDGGSVISDLFGLIGDAAGSKGTVTVTGIGSAWTSGLLSVGNAGTGALTVADGGAVQTLGIIDVASLAGSQGTLNIGAAAGDPAAAPGTLDTPQVVFGAGAGTLVFNHTSNAYTFAPVISGKGAIEAVSGTTLLTAASGGFTGTATVHGGATLGIDGTLGGTLDVLAGGRLEGTGTAGTVTVSGIVAPGHSIGTLHIAGNYTQVAGSTYQVEIDSAGHSDLIDVTGKATLSGGNVEVVPFPDFAIATPYTILTAAGGVTGTFASVSPLFISAFLGPKLTYDANDVFLTINQVASFASAALTPNEKAAAAGADSTGLGNPVWDAIALLPSASDAPAAFDAISGEIHASVQSVLINDSRYFREAMLGRLRQAAYANAGGQLAALGIGGPDMVYAYAGTESRSGLPVKALPVKAHPAAGYGLTYWAQGLGAWGHTDSDGDAASVNDDHAGFFTGFDARFGTWRAGLAGGYTHADADIDARASSANVDTAHIGAYAGTKLGELNVRGGAAFAWHSIDTDRTIAFPGFFDQANASYTGDTAQVFGEVGYGMQFGTTAAEPFAGLAYVHLDTNGFNETGGAAALSGNSASDDVGYSSLGIRAATRLTLADGKALVPHLSVAWQHAFGDVTPSAALAFASAGAAFTISGVPLARDAALVQAGLDYLIRPNAKLSLSYSGELAGNLQDHAVKGNFTWRF